MTNAKGSSVTANGREIVLEHACSLNSFLSAQGWALRRVVVEHNGEAVAPSEFARREVRPGDRLEIVTIVAGG
jgi:sulfur carrier protein